VLSFGHNAGVELALRLPTPSPDGASLHGPTQKELPDPWRPSRAAEPGVHSWPFPCRVSTVAPVPFSPGPMDFAENEVHTEVGHGEGDHSCQARGFGY